jgi:hypothetical protein
MKHEHIKTEKHTFVLHSAEVQQIIINHLVKEAGYDPNHFSCKVDIKVMKDKVIKGTKYFPAVQVELSNPVDTSPIPDQPAKESA